MMLASSRTDDGSSVQRRMRSSFILLACLSAACLSPAQAFQSSAPVFLVKSRIAEVGALFANEKEDYLPEVSFGAEVVPDGQKPVNEYQDMMNAPLFGWGSNEVGVQGLLVRLSILYAMVFAVVGFPIAGATFTQDGYLLQKIAASNVGTLGLIVVVLVRLYSGWGYVGARLRSKVIEYEETGWYDGNVEPKTESEIKRDNFLYQSDVKPACDRLKLFTLTTAALWLGSCIALNATLTMKPLFNEYDPTVLQRVRFDEDFAKEAAEASGGKPTYCNSRYYSAVAGGKGC